MTTLRGTAAALISAAALTLTLSPSASATAPSPVLAANSAGQALPVTGSFAQLWQSQGGASGFLGQPTSTEVPIRDGGVFQNFEGGTLYWTAPMGAHSVSGDFLRFYGGQGYENGFLGYPMTQEVPIRNGVFQVFQGGVLYWTPGVGAHSVSGSFRDLYGARGYENGVFGYPTSQEVPIRAGGVFQNFQGGTFYWSPTTGAQSLQGSILDAYRRTGSEGGSLGYPTSSEFDIPGGKRTNFQRGYIEWSPARGALVNQPVAGPAPAPTVSQRNAVDTAKSYLSVLPFSRVGLIEQLEYEKFSTADATYGADNAGANWYVQAEKMAASYLRSSSFSRQGLIEQLEYEGFTHDEAVHGVDSTGL